MAMMRTMTMFRISRCSISSMNTLKSELHTSSTTYLDQSWRDRRGWVQNPMSYGPLTNLPDYSFKDNRPVPYGSGQMRRIKQQQEYAKRVIKLVGEVDYAVEKHAKLLKEKEEKRQQILDSKLKPKGKQLLIDE